MTQGPWIPKEHESQRDMVKRLVAEAKQSNAPTVTLPTVTLALLADLMEKPRCADVHWQIECSQCSRIGVVELLHTPEVKLEIDIDDANEMLRQMGWYINKPYVLCPVCGSGWKAREVR